MKRLSFLLLFALCVNISTLSFAQEDLKTVTLADGTKVKGTITGFANGVYTIKTSNLGTLNIKDSDVVSITAGNAVAATETPVISKEAIQGQVNTIQKDVMSDPAMMQEIQNLMNDPEIMKMLSDENFVKDIMSYDPSRIESNDKTKQLLQNPNMQELMDKMGKKYNVETPQQ